jgi:hypothetical protein
LCPHGEINLPGKSAESLRRRDSDYGDRRPDAAIRAPSDIRHRLERARAYLPICISRTRIEHAHRTSADEYSHVRQIGTYARVVIKHRTPVPSG